MRFVILFLLGCSPLSAQVPLPAWGPAFPQNEVAGIYISINPDSLQALLDDEILGTSREFPAGFIFQSSGLTDTVAVVGLRARGNTSLGAMKKSFEISFNTYNTNGQWNDLEKLNLNGNHNDPSMIRPKLCWDAFRENNLPGSRTSFINLYINNEYRGVYTNTEHVDEEFAKKYFDGTGNGNLYKCLYPAPLEYLGNNGDDYKDIVFGQRPYDLKTNEWSDNYNDLALFVKVLNQTSLSSLKCELEKVFNADRYLQYIAMDILSGNWDNYAYNQNNYYLYHNEITGLFEYIPYDLDNTLGIDWVNQSWTTRNIYNWAPSSEQRPLFKRLLEVPEYRARFSYFIHQYALTSLNPENISQIGQTMIDLLFPDASADPFRALDYGFSIDDFSNSLTEAAGGHVEHGIVSFLEVRTQNALSQVDDANANSGVYGSRIISDFPFSNTGVVELYADASNYEVSWSYSTDGNIWSAPLILTDNGVAPDETATDRIYSAAIQITEQAAFVYYRFTIVAGQEIPRNYPCSNAVLFLQKADQGLFINELMSNNESVIADEENKYEDWIELWNGGASAVLLKGKYLTDDLMDPNKWPLPEATLFPGQFILFWADSDEEDGSLHCNFSLNAEGEEIRLYKDEQGALRLIDNVIFPALNTDISWGRTMDGAAEWINFSAPTPDASNFLTGLQVINNDELIVYPNPTAVAANFNKMIEKAIVFDIAGRTLREINNCRTIHLNDLQKGTYILKLDGEYRKIVLQ